MEKKGGIFCPPTAKNFIFIKNAERMTELIAPPAIKNYVQRRR